MDRTPQFAVIGRSQGEPTLYHLAPSRERAERLRLQREQARGLPCFVVPFSAWQANPLAALQEAERAASPPS